MSVALLLLGLASVLPTAAATYRVDDSATLPTESTALLRWRQLAPSRDANNTLEGAVAVAVRLQLAPWLDRQARLYLVCPEQGTAPVRVSWQSQGRLLAGEISPGERVLVYQGGISSPILEETLMLRIEADGSRLAGLQRLRFHFEIDTD